MERVIYGCIVVLVVLTVGTKSYSQKPRDRMRPAWKIDTSQLRDRHLFSIWALDDTTSTFEGDQDTIIKGILKEAKRNGHKQNSGIKTFEIDHYPSIANPKKLRLVNPPLWSAYKIQDTLFMVFEVLDTTATAIIWIEIRDSAGSGNNVGLYLRPTPLGLSLSVGVPHQIMTDFASPYWYLDSSDLRSKHELMLNIVDDTLLAEDDTSQIAKTIRFQLSQHSTPHQNSGLMEIYVDTLYSEFDTSKFRWSLSSWNGYAIQDTMRVTFSWLDTTATGLFRVVIADSTGVLLGAEAWFYITPSSTPLRVWHNDHSYFSIYPNPAADHLVVKSEQEEAVEIVGSDGKCLVRGKTNQPLSISGVASGRYFVRVGSNTHSLTIIR